MRIIAGEFRGLRLGSLKSDKLRPTSDQLRETLFDVLGAGIEGASFLDAYAGSGAVGLEALSRGAREVVFIEHHRAAVALIHKHLDTFDIGSGYRVMNAEVSKALERLAGENYRFNYVFLDPPYTAIREYHHALRQLGRGAIIGSGSTVIAEHSKHTRLEDQYGPLLRTRLLRHGDAELSFYSLLFSSKEPVHG
jgi:16S rRNA (guanine(966)-N(2))-methyltransferase RsmD